MTLIIRHAGSRIESNIPYELKIAGSKKNRINKIWQTNIIDPHTKADSRPNLEIVEELAGASDMDRDISAVKKLWHLPDKKNEN